MTENRGLRIFSVFKHHFEIPVVVVYPVQFDIVPLNNELVIWFWAKNSEEKEG